MLLTVYSWLLTLAQPFLRAKLRRRGARESGYLDAVEERFGHYAAAAANGASTGNFVWLHAVSLGETRACAILVERLRAALPGMRLLLTHGTATGRAEGAKLLKPGDLQAWLPWDTQTAVERFLDHFKPRICILMETEVWPLLVRRCQLRGIPVVLANARMSAKSLAQANRLPWLARPAYRGLTAVWAQTADDAVRLGQLGGRVAGVFGNLKFDAAPDAAQLMQGQECRRVSALPVVMFASSREGEEELLLQALLARHEAASDAGSVQWLVVPRHPQRFDEVALLFEGRGFRVSRRSTWTDLPGGLPLPGGVWLGDSLGEMAFYYGLATAALLGGSFAPLGGQNLIEAAACGCPIIMGPSTFNFADAAQLSQEGGAALRVASMVQAVEAALALAADRERHQQTVDAALRFSAAHRGAADKTAQAIKDLPMLAPSPRPASPNPPARAA